MTSPPYLQKGDLIGITAPARKICEDEVLPTVHLLEKEGFRVLLSPHIFAAEHQFAGSDAQRCADFQALINNSEVKAILCARGGYGSVRIIDRLDFTALQKNPKWIL